MAAENELVLIYFEGNPITYARIEEITADIKPDWYHVKLLLLQIPLTIVTWILRDIYINGEEFTMNGQKMKIELVIPPEEKKEDPIPHEKTKPNRNTGSSKIISLADLKKKG